MKKLYYILYIVLLVCVAGTVLFLILSPDRVPVHYNFAGEADRIGSKYENVIWPLFAVGLSVFFTVTARRQGQKKEPANEKILMIAGICTLIFFTLLGFFFLWKAMKYDPEAAPEVSFDSMNRFINIGIGALLVVLGNIMPKTRRNSLFGLRTKWSMVNDAVWQKSQRFGGITSVIGGFSLIILSLFIPGIWNTVLFTAVIIVWIALCVFASYRYYREDKENTTKRDS